MMDMEDGPQEFLAEIRNLGRMRECTEKRNYRVVRMLLGAVFEKVDYTCETKNCRTLPVGFSQIVSVCDFECHTSTIALTVEVKCMKGNTLTLSRLYKASYQLICSMFCQAAWQVTTGRAVGGVISAAGCLVLGLKVFFISADITRSGLQEIFSGKKPKVSTVFNIYPENMDGLDLRRVKDRKMIFSILAVLKVHGCIHAPIVKFT